MPSWIPDRWATDPRRGLERPRSWSGFFFFLSLATLLGVAKHGIPQYLGETGSALTDFILSLAAGLAVLHAEAATIQAHVRAPSLRRWLRRAALGKFALFVVGTALTASFPLVILDTALGLVPVTLAEWAAFRRGQRSAGWVAGGVAFSSSAALVYLLNVPSHTWFDHRDLAHVLMMVTLLLIFQGVRRPSALAPKPSMP